MVKFKRIREINAHENLTNMANCFILLSGEVVRREFNSNRVFECKTCKRQFASFQALGGHRASHKKPRLSMITDQNDSSSPKRSSSPSKPKSHECSICGLEFPIGQALGGHMRKHRAAINDLDHPSFLSLSPPHSPIIKKSNSRRMFCMDLNLTPSENKFLYGNITPTVDCFF